MTPDTSELLAANDEAQAAFHDMIVLGCQWNPDALATRAYVQSERAVDAVLAELQAPALAEGDHYARNEGVRV